jgi:hypothetical protein
MKPSVEPGRAVEGSLARSAEPDGDWLPWLRDQGRSVHAVEAAREINDRLREQPAEQRDLLLLPRTSGTEVLPKSVVLDVVPADSNPEPKTASGQEFDIRCLACDERRLPLRKHEDARCETDPLGDAGQVREHHEGVMEGVVLGVGSRQLAISIGVNGAEHVVVSEEIVKPQVLDGPPDPPNSGRISPKLDLRVDDADLHGCAV